MGAVLSLRGPVVDFSSCENHFPVHLIFFFPLSSMPFWLKSAEGGNEGFLHISPSFLFSTESNRNTK